MAPRIGDLPAGIRFDRHPSPESVTKLLDRIDGEGYETAEFRRGIVDPASVATAEMYARNIENYVGTVKVPVGLVGPLRVNGLYANGDFLVPLATTEAALVASYARGATVATNFRIARADTVSSRLSVRMMRV